MCNGCGLFCCGRAVSQLTQAVRTNAVTRSSVGLALRKGLIKTNPTHPLPCQTTSFFFSFMTSALIVLHTAFVPSRAQNAFDRAATELSSTQEEKCKALVTFSKVCVAAEHASTACVRCVALPLVTPRIGAPSLRAMLQALLVPCRQAHPTHARPSHSPHAVCTHVHSAWANSRRTTRWTKSYSTAIPLRANPSGTRSEPLKCEPGVAILT